MATNPLLADSNLVSSTISGELSLYLSAVIQSLPKKLDAIYTDSVSTTISIKKLNLELTNLNVPPANIQRYYELDKFNANFRQAFGTSFPVHVTSMFFFGIKITINNDLPYTSTRFLTEDELPAFRIITCMLLGLLFNISLDMCSCFPKTLNELKAVNAGLGLNCVNLMCKNMLKIQPLWYDDLIHTDCSDLVLNAAFVSLNLFAGKNINLDVDLTQTIV